MMMIIIKIMMIYNILDVSTTWIMNDASTQFQPCSLLTLFVTFTFLECRPQRNLVLLWTLILIWDAGTSEATSIVRHSDWLLHCFVSPELKQSRSVKSSIFCMKRHSTLHSKCTNVSCCLFRMRLSRSLSQGRFGPLTRMPAIYLVQRSPSLIWQSPQQAATIYLMAARGSPLVRSTAAHLRPVMKSPKPAAKRMWPSKLNTGILRMMEMEIW